MRSLPVCIVLSFLIVFSSCKDSPTTPLPPLDDLPNTPRQLLVDAPVGTVYNFLSSASFTDTNGVQKDAGGEIVPFTVRSPLKTDKDGNSYIIYSSNEEDRAMVANDTALWIAKADLSRVIDVILKIPFTKGTVLDKNFSISAVNEEITVPYGRVKIITTTQVDTIYTPLLYVNLTTTSLTKAAIPLAVVNTVKIRSAGTGTSKQTVTTQRLELHSIVKP